MQGMYTIQCTQKREAINAIEKYLRDGRITIGPKGIAQSSAFSDDEDEDEIGTEGESDEYEGDSPKDARKRSPSRSPLTPHGTQSAQTTRDRTASRARRQIA